MKKENSDFVLVYFKDDHNRILRVRITKRNGFVRLSVIDEKPPGKKDPQQRDMVHVFFPEASLQEVEKDPGVDSGTFINLKKEAEKCPINRRIKRARKFPV